MVLKEVPEMEENKNLNPEVEVEEATENQVTEAPKKEKKEQSKPTFYNEVELSLKETMRRKVQVKPTAKGKGTITIEFFSDKELSEFAKKLAGE